MNGKINNIITMCSMYWVTKLSDSLAGHLNNIYNYYVIYRYMPLRHYLPSGII